MQNVKSLPEKLKEKKSFNLSMMIGFDGFVDEITHIVDKRMDHENYTKIPTIAKFGERMSNAAGLSTNVEFAPVYAKLGGNGPILANALIEYGVSLTYVGLLGKPSIHPVFEDMVEKSKAIYSLGDPGHTYACEFEDGKIMVGKHATLRDLTWESFKESLGGLEGIAKVMVENTLMGMVNWTMITHMSAIWEGIIEEVFPLLPERTKKPYVFFDLADPEKRTKEDILHAMRLISRFEEKFHAILGLNEKEAFHIANLFEIEIPEDGDRLKTVATGLYEKMGIYCLLVHPVRSACCVIDGKYYHTEGPYCPKPVLTTGAGDNFNAGFCLGLTIGLDPLLALTLGVCTSGYYVRNAHSPTYDQVIQFAQKWAEGKVDG